MIALLVGLMLKHPKIEQNEQNEQKYSNLDEHDRISLYTT